jgi:hypothetical protein
MKVILVKVVDIDFQNTVIPYFHRMPLRPFLKRQSSEKVGFFSQISDRKGRFW